MADVSTLLIAFDGSPAAARAIEQARAVSSAQNALVVTVWESSLPATSLAVTDGISGVPLPPVDPRASAAIDEAASTHAQRVAEQGASLARTAGFDATPLVVEEALNVAEALAELAVEHGAQAIVVGSHGHGKLRERVLGSTSSSLIRHARCPVIVVPSHS